MGVGVGLRNVLIGWCSCKILVKIKAWIIGENVCDFGLKTVCDFGVKIGHNFGGKIVRFFRLFLYENFVKNLIDFVVDF